MKKFFETIRIGYVENYIDVIFFNYFFKKSNIIFRNEMTNKSNNFGFGLILGKRQST